MSTGINYLDETWSPITGCSGKGCKAHCWAREMVKRFPAIHDDGKIPLTVPLFHEVVFHPDRLNKPLHWRKPRRIGVAFMGDWMDDQVQCSWVDQILDVISACPQHQFFSLTKQPQNLEEKIYGHCPDSPARELGGGDYLPNLWHGISICDQEDADRMIPDLLKVLGKRWVSIEPMLGPVELKPYWFREAHTLTRVIDWVVIGCESGPKRRPCYWPWMIDVVNQCRAAGVPVYVKQMLINGRVSHNPEDWPAELRVREI